MRYQYIFAIFLTAFSFSLILDSLHVWTHLSAFLIAGVVPGSHITLSAPTMLSWWTLLLGLLLGRLYAPVQRRLFQLTLTAPLSLQLIVQKVASLSVKLNPVSRQRV
ncbi:MAG: hypothetical protein JWN33_243 [Candidatus Saccharibacteria bacterium]|nr:hypothetical protein [Candidatus Saccharibacteria bacterium]